MDPILASVIFAFGIAVLAFALFPEKGAEVFSAPLRRKNVKERIQDRLRSARIFDQTPTVFVAGILIASAITGLVISILIGSVFGLLIGPIVVALGITYYLNTRERDFITKATDELIPFLNRISTAVSAGATAQTAYLNAVEEADVLREVLEDSAARIQSGAKFSDALIDTLELLPLRMWAVFVRQMELYDEVGGDVATALETTTAQVNAMLRLQSEARADYAIQAKQQKLIIIIIGVFFLAYFFLVPGSIDQLQDTVTSVGGIIGMLVAASVLCFGLWFRQKQLRDVERKLSF